MKLLIVDDHAVVREGLAAMLRHAEAISSILQADGGEAGLAIAREHGDLAMIILDLTMPGMAGTEAIAAFGAARPDVPIIVLSASESRADAQAALDAGALLLSGASERRSAGLPALTERQTDVLVMLAKGGSNKEIARALRLSDKTVKAHVSAIFKALNVSNRTQAAHAARQAGLL
jgi:DNA-binding NarL/FixJ family response regulator